MKNANKLKSDWKAEYLWCRDCLYNGYDVDEFLFSIVVIFWLVIPEIIFCSNLFLYHILLLQVNNILIVNLAISDLLLCTVISPVTLVQTLYKCWMGPKLKFLCQLSGMMPGLLVFVSTLTITGIAIDR